jgi:hypothetical protein
MSAANFTVFQCVRGNEMFNKFSICFSSRVNIFLKWVTINDQNKEYSSSESLSNRGSIGKRQLKNKMSEQLSSSWAEIFLFLQHIVCKRMVNFCACFGNKFPLINRCHRRENKHNTETSYFFNEFYFFRSDLGNNLIS